MRCWLAVLLVLATGGASAQNLVPPDEIVIHVNGDVRNTDFVEPLVCELQKVVRPPVRARKIDLALTDDLLEAGRQFSPRKIVRRFAAAAAPESDQPNPFHYLILDHDLKVPGLHYVFAETYKPPMSVISVVRLTPGGWFSSKKTSTEATLHRVYKLMLKSVAIMAGLKSEGCVMMFPRSLDELDDKPSEYCANDRAALVAAGVIKETPSASCSTVVAMAR
jgi:predicted Zn-dependent protease